MKPAILSFRAPSLTIDQLAKLADSRRKKLGFEKFDMRINVDLVKAIEYAHDVELKVLPNRDLPDHYAVARPDLNPPEIHIRDAVYQQACDCGPEAIFTLSHELGHIDCHHELQPPGRMLPHFEIPKQCSGEWQANIYGLLLLAPPSLVANINYKDKTALTQWFGIPSSEIEFYMTELGELL